jgi:superfamily II DNA/RNA helicase
VLVVTQVAASASGLVLAETSALVLAPTRELAVQIDAECTRFGEPLGVASAAVYGGAAKDKQLALVSKGVHVLVATPGRLNDFLQAGSVRLDECTYVVIDEADRMLDLGFEPQVSPSIGGHTLTLHGTPPTACSTWL